MSQSKTLLQRVAALVLWLVTIVLGIADIYFLREIFFALYARVSRDNAVALLWGNIIVVLGAILFVGYAIASGEYHRKHFGTARSWRLIVWALAIGVAIPLLALLLGGSL